MNGTHNLIQAGTILTSGLVYHPFYEFVPDPNNGNTAYIDYADTLPCGTSIYAEAYYSTYLHLWCTDMQWSASGYGQCYSPLGTYTPDQSTAEWIDERPLCGLKLAYLADFVVTNWTNVYATSTTHGKHTLAGSNPYSLTMINEYNQSDILVQPDLTLSLATAFNDTWHDYGTDGANCTSF